ncbi:hypothetical protein GQ42DRAFT_155904 [Ramicandelaber brevisporus]|nr:hypothetical protein GQ42DRAFT_155904 [Ramicandelaber brevisporus]
MHLPRLFVVICSLAVASCAALEAEGGTGRGPLATSPATASERASPEISTANPVWDTLGTMRRRQDQLLERLWKTIAPVQRALDIYAHKLDALLVDGLLKPSESAEKSDASDAKATASTSDAPNDEKTNQKNKKKNGRLGDEVALPHTKFFTFFTSTYFAMVLLVSILANRIDAAIPPRLRPRPLSRIGRVIVRVPCLVVLARATAAMIFSYNECHLTADDASQWNSCSILRSILINKWMLGSVSREFWEMDGKVMYSLEQAQWLLFKAMCLVTSVGILVSRLESGRHHSASSTASVAVQSDMFTAAVSQNNTAIMVGPARQPSTPPPEMSVASMYLGPSRTSGARPLARHSPRLGAAAATLSPLMAPATATTVSSAMPVLLSSPAMYEPTASLIEWALILHFQTTREVLAVGIIQAMQMLLLESTLLVSPAWLARNRLLPTGVFGLAGLLHFGLAVAKAVSKRSEVGYPPLHALVRIPEMVVAIVVTVCTLCHFLALLLAMMTKPPSESHSLQRSHRLGLWRWLQMTYASARAGIRPLYDESSLPSLSDDYSIAIFKLGNACLEATRFNGFRNEGLPIQLPHSTSLDSWINDARDTRPNYRLRRVDDSPVMSRQSTPEASQLIHGYGIPGDALPPQSSPTSQLRQRHRPLSRQQPQQQQQQQQQQQRGRRVQNHAARAAQPSFSPFARISARIGMLVAFWTNFIAAGAALITALSQRWGQSIHDDDLSDDDSQLHLETYQTPVIPAIEQQQAPQQIPQPPKLNLYEQFVSSVLHDTACMDDAGEESSSEWNDLDSSDDSDSSESEQEDDAEDDIPRLESTSTVGDFVRDLITWEPDVTESSMAPSGHGDESGTALPSFASVLIAHLMYSAMESRQQSHPERQSQAQEHVPSPSAAATPRMMTRSRFRQIFGDNSPSSVASTPVRQSTLWPGNDRRQQMSDLVEETRSRASPSDFSKRNPQPAVSSGAEALPVCVVCHTEQRTILLHPCRCLSLCDDCRQAMAARKFDLCPCCRAPVEGFSRVFTV